MKPVAFVFFVCFAGILTGCAEPLPLKVGVCKDNVCANIETVIPARKEAARSSGKEVLPVQ
jgi:hypothetical protein